MLGPTRKGDSLDGHPVLRDVETSHGREEEGNHMREAEVNKKNLSKLPILLIIDIPDEVNLQFFYLMQTLRQLEDDEESKHADDGVTGGDIEQ